MASLAASLRAAADRTAATGDTAATNGSFTGAYEALKARFTVTGVPAGSGLVELLDAAKSADVVVAVVSAAGPGGVAGAVDDEGLRRVAALRAHGMPAAVGYLQHLGALGPKAQGDFKRMAGKFMADEFGDHAKLAPPGSTAAALAAAPFVPLGGGAGSA